MSVRLLSCGAVILVILPVSSAGARQDQDEARARTLVGLIGGLSEDFTDEQFLDRAAVRELLVLDRAAVVPLQEVLTQSADWSARATAAYLLFQINDTSGFLQAWNKETHPITKAVLFPGTKRYVADYGVLLRELDQFPSLTDPRRDGLQDLTDTLPPLSESQLLLWTKRLTSYLALPHDQRSNPPVPQDTRRVITILERAGPECLTALIEAFHTARSEDTTWGTVWGLASVLGRIAEEPSQATKAAGVLDRLLEVATLAAAHVSTDIRGRSLELLTSLALLLDSLGSDPERALELLRGMASADPSEELRAAATRWLSVWKERKAARMALLSRKNPTGDNESERKSHPLTAEHDPSRSSRESRDRPGSPGGQESGQVAVAILIAFGLLLLGALLLVRRTRNRAS